MKMRINHLFILYILYRNFKNKMDTENYISPNKITKQYDITSGTLRRWSEAGKIRCIRPNGGKRIYNIEDIKKIFNTEKQDLQKTPIEKVDSKNELFNALRENVNNLQTSDSSKLEIQELLLKFNNCM